MGSNKIKKKLDTNSDKLFDKIKNQYNQLSSKFTSKEEDNVKLLSYTKDGKKVISNEKEDDKETKDKWWQKGTKAIGNKVKNKVQNDSVKGGSGDASIEVEVVNNQAVEEQSAIVGKQTVNLKVKGKTELIGGNIANQGGNVDLQTNGLELQDVNGKHSQGGARVKGASSAIKMLGSAASDLMGGKTPLIGAHGGSEQKNAVAGITHGQP
ncbi:Hemolysin [Yersinia frederiksenii]|nr:Hemolysin [Yersinia frederiksenii]CNI99551.1 Hemolysin [Yersinia frederiksenii]